MLCWQLVLNILACNLMSVCGVLRLMNQSYLLAFSLKEFVALQESTSFSNVDVGSSDVISISGISQIQATDGKSLFTTYLMLVILIPTMVWMWALVTLQLLLQHSWVLSSRNRKVYILGISNQHFNISVLIGLHWPSIRAMILKLSFLAKLLEKCDGLCAQLFYTLAYDVVYEVSLVHQCRPLEQLIGTNYLQLCLENPAEACPIICEAKADIL